MGIPLWKWRGNCWSCSNCRSILCSTLLSISGKVFVQILLERIRDHLLKYQRLEQSRFIPGKSTIDRILALQVIMEHRREFGCGALAVYIDFQNAFDSMHRKLLREILRMEFRNGLLV